MTSNHNGVPKKTKILFFKICVSKVPYVKGDSFADDLYRDTRHIIIWVLEAKTQLISTSLNAGGRTAE